MGENKTIPEFFIGQTIFVTGGSGFMGKVLIEKLLRSCPDLEKIYILVRHKKNKSPEERIKMMLELPLFKLVLNERPQAVDKIKPIVGDVMKIGLGLSSKDRQLLIDEVTIVYHAAASVRFDDHLTDAIIMNTRGTREVALLAREMKKITAFLHFSTTYCHSDKKIIGEHIYPAHTDWRDAIKLAENVDRCELDVLTKKYIDPLPNTYTYTKALAEHVVNDLCASEMPTVIVRPSIVISTWSDPIPGWIDNFNGPVGLLVAVGKGALRSVYTDLDLVADYVPVDIIIRGIIASTWRAATTKNDPDNKEITVYNCSQCDVSPVTMKEILHLGSNLLFEYPPSRALWFPECQLTKCWYMHYLRVIFFHLLPAILIDGLLKISGHTPILIKIHRKIYTANMALEYFITNEWSFLNGKGRELEKYLAPSDHKDFHFCLDEIDPDEYFRRAMAGGREYLLKESPSTLPSARKQIYRLWCVSRTLYGIYYFLIFYFLWYKIPYGLILKCVSKYTYDYFASL